MGNGVIQRLVRSPHSEVHVSLPLQFQHEAARFAHLEVEPSRIGGFFQTAIVVRRFDVLSHSNSPLKVENQGIRYAERLHISTVHVLWSLLAPGDNLTETQ